MRTKAALSVFSGEAVADTFLSNPEAADYFQRVAEVRRARVKEHQAEVMTSTPHERLLARKAREAIEGSILDPSVPVIDRFSAYQVAKEASVQDKKDHGLRSLVTHLKHAWEADRQGFF